MIVKCPRCEHEFDLELETCVVEMLFECPDCKTKFMVGNTDDHPAKKAVESERKSEPKPAPKPAPVQQVTENTVLPQKEEKESDWVLISLRLLVCLLVFFLFMGMIATCAHKVQHKKQEEAVEVEDSAEVVDTVEVEEVEEEGGPVPVTEASANRHTRIYEDGYKIGYTIDDETYKLWGGEGYFRSLWGVYATYDMLQNDALYKEYRRGLLDGMAKRRNDTGRGTNYY